ncbi:MAG: hypothetical protein MUE81_07465 [Thermoflexibacter sp.]|jgi:hypothetical protein|nr:hypothetical protein [Thermoflexibacter sp.]
MIVEINKGITTEEIKRLISNVFIQKRIKGYPDLDKFFGVLQPRNYTQIQKIMRDEWG